jgi:hypothetical protein
MFVKRQVPGDVEASSKVLAYRVLLWGHFTMASIDVQAYKRYFRNQTDACQLCPQQFCGIITCHMLQTPDPGRRLVDVWQTSC